jgi:hypothetical protein
MRGAVFFRFAEQLGQHVDSSVQYIAYYMSVVIAQCNSAGQEGCR